MGLITRNPVFGVFDKASFKPLSSATATSSKKLNFTCSKFTYNAFQNANYKSADQTAWMRRLSAPVLFAYPQRQVFSRRGPDNRTYPLPILITVHSNICFGCIKEMSPFTRPKVMFNWEKNNKSYFWDYIFYVNLPIIQTTGNSR